MEFVLRVVNGLSGEEHCLVNARPGWNGMMLKAAITEISGVAKDQQRLFVHGKALIDEETLSLDQRPTEIVLMQISKEKADAIVAARMFGDSIGSLSEDLRADPEVVATAVQKNGTAIRFAIGSAQHDRGLALAAVGNLGLSLKYVAVEHRSDLEIVLTAIERNGSMFEFASKDIQKNRAVVLAAVRNGVSLSLVPDEFKSDRDVVSTAVECHGAALKFASVELKRNHDVVMAAVKSWPPALEFASLELRGCADIVLAGVDACSQGTANTNKRFLRFASTELFHNPGFVKALVSKDTTLKMSGMGSRDHSYLKHAPPDVHLNDVVIQAVKLHEKHLVRNDVTSFSPLPPQKRRRRRL